MIRLLLFVLFTTFLKVSFSQKGIIDTGAIRNWGSVYNGIISSNANYICYNVKDPNSGKFRLVIESTKNNWKKEFPNGKNADFTKDSKRLIFIVGKDSLYMLQLVKGNIKIIPAVRNYEFSDVKRNTLLVYQLANELNQLVVLNSATGKERIFNWVNSYKVQGKTMLLYRYTSGDKLSVELDLVDLETSKMKKLWTTSAGNRSLNYAFNFSGSQMAFIVENKSGSHSQNQIWYYENEMDSAHLLLSGGFYDLDSSMRLSSSLLKFSEDGTRIYFNIETDNKQSVNTNDPQVDIWSYTDDQLLPEYKKSLVQGTISRALISLATKKVIRIEQENERICDENEDWALVEKSLGQLAFHEATWNSAAGSSFSLVSKKDGKVIPLTSDVKNQNEKPGLSPGGKWVIYFDLEQKNFFSYEIATGILRNFTKGIRANWMKEELDTPEQWLNWFPYQRTWIKNDEAVFIYDNYDIWLIDPKGIRKPINETNGYGLTHKIKFLLSHQANILQSFSLCNKSSFVLTAFNKVNKQMGFFQKVPGTNSDPMKLSMGPYLYGKVFAGADTYQDGSPLIVNAKCQYLVLRQSATDAPNYFLTSDLITFKKVTNVQPQKSFNWYTSELHNWTSYNGETLQGVLYKPENFDSTKRYPVILEYYERKSDLLNKFLIPEVSTGDMNIPWFVSRGYLVFVPDIHYTIGSPGQSAYNSVLSAAQYLSRFKFIDSSKMGLHGHSFGAYETNYIITHSKKFAAGCSAAGVTDLISRYGSAERGGYSISHTENRQGRIGYSFAERPDLYIINSPIFYVNKIETPFLILNNKGDKQVPFSQGVELFTQMRRLGKRVWMLQYGDGGHDVYERSAVDYTTRLMQFFDHYLKDSACPRWMLYGIPAKDKGVDDGLELVKEKDKNGKWLTPPEGGLLTPEEKKKAEALQKRKQVTITFE